MTPDFSVAEESLNDALKLALDITPYVSEVLKQVEVRVEESVEAEIVEQLRSRGYLVTTPEEQGLRVSVDMEDGKRRSYVERGAEESAEKYQAGRWESDD